MFDHPPIFSGGEEKRKKATWDRKWTQFVEPEYKNPLEIPFESSMSDYDRWFLTSTHHDITHNGLRELETQHMQRHQRCTENPL